MADNTSENDKRLANAKAHASVRAAQALDAPLARADYEDAQRATREKTARLRALRLARDAK
jgi:hypothetical protein